MKFCTNCGRELKETHKFCPNCRAEVSAGKETKSRVEAKAPPPRDEQPIPAPAAVQQPRKPRPPMSKRNKWIVAGLGTALIVLIPAHLVLSSASSPEKAIEDFQAAVVSEDPAAVTKLLYNNATGEHVTEEHAEGLIEYFNSTDAAIIGLETFLTDQLELVTSASAAEDIHDYQPPEYVSFLTFENTGSTFFFYDQYQIGIESYPLYISTNYEDATIQVNGETVEKEQQEDGAFYVGDYPAGLYELSASGGEEFSDLVYEDLIFLDGLQNFAQMNFDLDFVYIYSNVEDAKLFVNGEDSGEVLETGQNEYGPFVLDGSTEIHAEAETPFGTLVSSPALLDSPYPYGLEVEANEDIISDAVNDIQADIQEINDGVVEGFAASELLESVDFYTDSYQLYNDQFGWTLEIDAEENWLSGSETYGTGELDTTPLTESKKYVLNFNENVTAWTFDRTDFVYNLSTPGSAMTTVEINDPDLLAAAFETEAEEEEEITEDISMDEDNNNSTEEENAEAEEDNDSEEEGSNVYAEDPEEHLNTLMHNYYRSFADALYDAQFFGIADTGHTFFTYIAPEAEDFQQETLTSIEDYMTMHDTTYFIDAEVLDYSVSEETYTVITEVELEISESDGQITRQLLETEHEVILREDGFYVIDRLDTEVISEEAF